MFKKLIKLIAIGTISATIVFGANFLQNKECSACNEYTCVDSGEVEYYGQFLPDWCIYQFKVSVIYGCEYEHYVWIWNKSTDVTIPLQMYFSTRQSLCATYTRSTALQVGVEYEIWFECTGLGETVHIPVTPDCW
jgi:hypothetical protein